MKEPGSGNAKAHGVWVERQPGVHQEDQIQQEQRKAQLDQDFGWDVFAQLAVEVKLWRQHVKNTSASKKKEKKFIEL